MDSKFQVRGQSKKKKKKSSNKHLYSINKLLAKTNMQNYCFLIHYKRHLFTIKDKRHKTPLVFILLIILFCFLIKFVMFWVEDLHRFGLNLAGLG